VTGAVTLDGLTDSGWLLSYDAGVKGWLGDAHLAQDPDFQRMRQANVEFYQTLPNPALATIPLPPSGFGVGSVMG
jgi:hypothetical protein